MKLTANRLVLAISIYLMLLVGCANPRSSHPGYVYYSRDSAIKKFDLATDQETLLLNQRPIEGMSISPNGKWLSYTMVEEIRQNSPRSIWIVNVHTGQEIEVSRNVPFAEAFWHPDNQLVILEYPDWHISSNGARLTKGYAYPLIFEPSEEQKENASWSVVSPVNGRVLYAPTFDCAAEVAIDHQSLDKLRVICQNVEEPTTVATPMSLGDVVWSSDGSFLAFHSAKETTTRDSWRLYIWQRETGTLQEIELGDRGVFGLSWSPDNQWLAFEDDSDLCLVRTADGGLVCLQDYISTTGVPVSWSFDSQSVVIVTCASGICSQIECDCSNKALVVVDVPSGEITELTAGADSIPTPIWGR